MTNTPPPTHPEPTPPSQPTKKRMRPAQKLTLFAVAFLALSATAIMTTDVILHGPPGSRNTILNITGKGKQPLYLPAPTFQLTDAFNNPVSDQNLRGKVTVYNFIFTRCVLICPMMSQRMLEVQNQLLQHGDPNLIKQNVKLVSISIDGEHDTPQILNTYGYDPDRGAIAADKDMWWFLTGPKATVWPIVEQGFKLPVESDPTADIGMQIGHSPRFVLVDQQGKIYNYYDSESPQDIDAMLADIARLLKN